MDLVPQHPPDGAVELAFALLHDSLDRGMEYEEFSFEIEGGGEDGGEYKVIVMKV